MSLHDWAGGRKAQRFRLLIAVLLPEQAHADCDRSECIARCVADCEQEVGRPELAARCSNTCRGSVCSYEASCENRLGYRPELLWGAHMGYGLGAALIPQAVQTGFRHHLEAAAALGPGKQWLSLGNSITGSTTPSTGLLVGASGLLGIGSSPSYALAEGGYGRDSSLAALGVFVGVGSRLSSGMAPVLGLRANLDVLLVNLGLRTLVSLEQSPDVLLCATLGVGRY
jgi:hypothetical protein